MKRIIRKDFVTLKEAKELARIRKLIMKEFPKARIKK